MFELSVYYSIQMIMWFAYFIYSLCEYDIIHTI